MKKKKKSKHLKFIVILVVFAVIGYFVYVNNFQSPTKDLNEVENPSEPFFDDIDNNEEVEIQEVISFIEKLNNGEIQYIDNMDYAVVPNFGKILVREEPVTSSDRSKLTVGRMIYITFATPEEEYILTEYFNESVGYEGYKHVDEIVISEQVIKGKRKVNYNLIDVMSFQNFISVYNTGMVDTANGYTLESKNENGLIVLNIVKDAKVFSSFQTDGLTFANVYNNRNELQYGVVLNNAEKINKYVEIAKDYDFTTTVDIYEAERQIGQINEDALKALEQYIEDQKPKNETYDVETVDELDLSNSLRYSNETLVNAFGFLGTLVGGQNFEIVANVTLNLTESVIQKTTTDGQTTYTVKATKTDIVKTSVGTVDDYSLDVTIVIASDGSCQVDYKSVVVYKSDDVKFKIETTTVETFNIVGNRIDKSTLSSKSSAKISDFEAVDSYNNKYVINTMDYTEDNTSSVITMFVGNYIAKQ